MWWLNITYPQYSFALLKNVQASVLASACDVYLCKCCFFFTGAVHLCLPGSDRVERSRSRTVFRAEADV